MQGINSQEGVFLKSEYAKGPTFLEMSWAARVTALKDGAALIKITGKPGTKPGKRSVGKQVALPPPPPPSPPPPPPPSSCGGALCECDDE